MRWWTLTGILALAAACGGVVPPAPFDAAPIDAVRVELDGGDLPDASSPDVWIDASPDCPTLIIQPGSCYACCQGFQAADDAGTLFCPYCHIQTITGASSDKPGYCADQPCCDPPGVYTGVCP